MSGCSARYPSGRPVDRRCPRPAALWSDQSSCCPPAHKPPPAAARPASWFSPAGEYALRSRLPDSTAPTVRSPSLIACSIGSGSGPELPMQQPYPTRLNPSSFQIGGEFGAVEVVGHHFGSRRQRGFYQGLLRSPFDGIFRQQAGRHHHARVGGVGAGGDRRDHHRAVAQFVLLPVQRKGFAVGIGLVPPISSSVAALNACGTFGSATRSCGRFGPARLASTVDMSSASELVKTGSSPGLRHALRFGVGFHPVRFVRRCGR